MAARRNSLQPRGHSEVKANAFAMRVPTSVGIGPHVDSGAISAKSGATPAPIKPVPKSAGSRMLACNVATPAGGVLDRRWVVATGSMASARGLEAPRTQRRMSSATCCGCEAGLVVG